MCGIAGFQLVERDTPKSDDLASELLLGIEERGRHATGVAWWEDGEVWLSKEAMPAREFVNTYEHVPAGRSTAILHTRFATQGSPKVNANNHPIDVGGYVGVHNGVLWNDDELWRQFGQWDKVAEVDSEAIFGALAYSEQPPAAVLSAVQGSAAVAWFAEEADTLWLARVTSSPLVWGRAYSGSILFASTKKALRRAEQKAKIPLRGVFEIDEGRIIKVQHASLVSVERFAVEAQELTLAERYALNMA